MLSGGVDDIESRLIRADERQNEPGMRSLRVPNYRDCLWQRVNNLEGCTGRAARGLGVWKKVTCSVCGSINPTARKRQARQTSKTPTFTSPSSSTAS